MKPATLELSHSLSLYLDVVRFSAAVFVYLHHVSASPFTSNLLWAPLEAYGNVAVTVFFVLSGYLIAYVTHTRERSLTQYAIARVARIYSVVLVALLCTWVLDNLGMLLNPDFYAHQKVMWKPQSIESYAASAFFLNEYQILGFDGIAPGSNGPYWSLSFEVTYYAIAGLLLFSRHYLRFPVALVVLCLAGKTIAALAPLWALGYSLFYLRFSMPRTSVIVFSFVGSAVMLAMTPFICGLLPSDNLGVYFPWGRGAFNRNLLEDYAAAMFFSVNLICARALMDTYSLPVRPKATVLIRWLGSLTFPLYLLHFPAIAFFSAISPWPNDGAMHLLYITVSTFILVAAATPVCDQLKSQLKRLKRLRPKRHQTAGPFPAAEHAAHHPRTP